MFGILKHCGSSWFIFIMVCHLLSGKLLQTVWKIVTKLLTNVYSCTTQNKIHWNLNLNSSIFIKKMHLKNAVCKILIILFLPNLSIWSPDLPSVSLSPPVKFTKICLSTVHIGVVTLQQENPACWLPGNTRPQPTSTKVHFLCLVLGVSSGYARPITGQVT